MNFSALALGLVIQAQSAEPVADPAADLGAELEGAAEPALPVDAASLIVQIDGQWSAYSELAAELAARQARERFLSELLLPVIARSDLEPGAQGEILREAADTIAAVEGGNTQWAVRQLNPGDFTILFAEQPRLAQQILRFAERDTNAEGRIVAALEATALAGRIDGPAYARRADAHRVANGQRQFYGTAEICTEDGLQPAPIAQPGRLAERRAALGLLPMDAVWTESRDRDCQIELPESASEAIGDD